MALFFLFSFQAAEKLCLSHVLTTGAQHQLMEALKLQEDAVKILESSPRVPIMKHEKAEVAVLKPGFLAKIMPCHVESRVVAGLSSFTPSDVLSPEGSATDVKSDPDLDIAFIQPAIPTSESIHLRWCNMWPAKFAPKSIRMYHSSGRCLYGCPSPGCNHTATNTNAGWAHVAKQHMLSAATCPQCGHSYTQPDEMVKHLKSSGH